MSDTLEIAVTVAASPEEVFDYFVQAELLVRWLGIGARIDARAGGEFAFEVASGEWCLGNYLVIEPPHRVSFTWGWENPVMSLPPRSTTVEVELIPVEQETRVVLRHNGLTGDSYLLHADGWSRYLDRLSLSVVGDEPGPAPSTETPNEALRRLRR